MTKEHLTTGEAYLKAWNNQALEEIKKYLYPEVHFIGPMTETTGNEKVLQSAKRTFGMLKALEVRSRFVSGDQAIFTYDFVCTAPIGVCRTAELMTFKDDMISRIGLFFDARPFEKLMQSQPPVAKSA